MILYGDQISIGYFGKLSTRADFVKAADDALLINIVDEWLTNAMARLTIDPRWKIIYDEISPIYFLVAATKMSRAVAGYLVASRDQAERRFPFASFGKLSLQNPEVFLTYSPLVLADFWSRLDSQTKLVMDSEDSAEPLRALCSDDVIVDIAVESHHDVFQRFIQTQTIGDLDERLTSRVFGGSTRQLLLALGLLLHPVMASGVSRLDKNLILPLPEDAQSYLMIASLWMHIVGPFLFNSDFEVAVLLTTINRAQVMVIGFDGASANTLCSVMTPMIRNESNIWFDNTAWVEDMIREDYRLQQLSSYLEQSELQLSTALVHFKETFLG
ncbi:MAG TPA: type VI secretion system-associated protein TagF [Methylophilaceae bacterium]|jgi:type VI secretion system protein ImpM